MEIEVEGRMELVCVLLPCALCEVPFEICGGAPIFIALSDDGEPVGRVCPRCVLAGEDGLRRRMLRRTEYLRKKAERLEKLAGEGVRTLCGEPVEPGAADEM